jgi:hypothetical protein
MFEPLQNESKSEATLISDPNNTRTQNENQLKDHKQADSTINRNMHKPDDVGSQKIPNHQRKPAEHKHNKSCKPKVQIQTIGITLIWT